MKNLLIITHQYYPKGGATANILEYLSSVLIKSGFNVTIVTTHSDTNENQIYLHNSVKVVSISNRLSSKKKMIIHLKKREFVQLIATVFYAIHKKIINKFKDYKIVNAISYELKMKHEIAKIVKAQKIDLIISVCIPFESNFLAYSIKKKTNIKWVMYMLDPFFNNCYFDKAINERKIKIGERIRIEKRLLETADLAIVTDLIYESYENNGFNEYLNKVVKLKFPLIREVVLKDNVAGIKLDKTYINCVFTGFLDRYIRNPKVLFDAYKNFHNHKIRLYIIGGEGQFEEGFIEFYEEILKDQLILVQRVEKDVAFDAMLNADILINIGNTVANQLPSKIFDYISCGKPIVNLYKIENCPTLQFTKRYPLCLDIYEGNGLSDSAVNRFEKFCVENKSKRISYSTIKEIYADCTGEVIGRKFAEEIEKVLDEKV